MAKKTQTPGPWQKTVDRLDAEIPKEGETFSAKVNGIVMTTAGAVYGEHAKDPKRSVATLSFEGNGVAGKATMSYARMPNPRSNLFKFLKQYGKAPFVGQTVTVRQDENGFWRLVLE